VFLLAFDADERGRLRVVSSYYAVNVFYCLAACALELFWRQGSAGLFAAAIIFLQIMPLFFLEGL
jgi:hypothetical protein